MGVLVQYESRARIACQRLRYKRNATHRDMGQDLVDPRKRLGVGSRHGPAAKGQRTPARDNFANPSAAQSLSNSGLRNLHQAERLVVPR